MTRTGSRFRKVSVTHFSTRASNLIKEGPALGSKTDKLDSKKLADAAKEKANEKKGEEERGKEVLSCQPLACVMKDVDARINGQHYS